MKQFSLIGKDIGYSLSPDIHNSHFKSLNIEACYTLKDINDLDQSIEELRQLSGFNVTKPYKEKIISYCDDISQEAKTIGAVNCVKVENNQFYGYNTDVYGFYQLLKKHQLIDKTKRVLIIGAGGAGKAVYYCFNEIGNDITMTNRTLSKARKTTNKAMSIINAENYLSEFDIVVNCTSVGVSPININKIKKDAYYIDINYQSKTPFLTLADKQGAKTINGMDMLLYQAAKSFEIWFQKKANMKGMWLC